MTDTTIILVHGVGDPREGAISSLVRQAFKKVGIDVEKVHEFNWNAIVDHPVENGLFFDRAFRIHAIKEISEGIIRAAHLGFLGAPSCYGGISGFRLIVHNVVASVFQISLQVALVITLVMSLLYRTIPAWLVWYFLSLSWVLMAAAVSHFQILPVVVTLRRIILMCTLFAFFLMTVLGLLNAFQLFFLAFAKYAIEKASEKPSAWDEYIDVQSSVISINPLISFLVMLASPFLIIVFTVLFGKLVARTIGHLTKVCADIFRYIAFPSFRQHIQHAFKNFMKSVLIDSHHRIIIAGHSLGSIIVADFLVSNHHLFSQKDIVFITAGSPMDRVFNRFFPGIYNSPMAIKNYLSQMIERFRWINVYRHLDPIGGKLKFGASSSASNVCINQWRCSYLLGFAHVNYWNDPQVIESVSQVLGSEYRHDIWKEHSVTNGQVENWEPGYYNASLDRLFEGIRFVGKVIIAGIAVGTAFLALWVATTFVMLPFTTPKKLINNRKQLIERGKLTNGTVCWDESKIDDTFQIIFAPNDQNKKYRDIREDIFNPYAVNDMNGVDVDKLENEIRDKGYWRKTHAGDKHLCLDGVRIRFLADDPKVYDLPDYQQDITHPGILVVLSCLIFGPILFILAILFVARYAWVFWDNWVRPLFAVLFMLEDEH